MKKIMKTLATTAFAVFTLTQFATAQPVEMIPLHGEYASSGKVVFTIMGNGFTETEQSTFMNVAQVYANSIKNMYPYNLFIENNTLSINAVKINDAVSGHAAGTYFELNNNWPSSQTGWNRIDAVLSGYTPNYTAAIIMSNNKNTIIGAYADFGRRLNFLCSGPDGYVPGAMGHEFGHSIAGLIDIRYVGTQREAATYSQTSDPKLVRWKNFIGLPGGNDDVVGVTEHNGTGWYYAANDLMGTKRSYSIVSVAALIQFMAKKSGEPFYGNLFKGHHTNPQEDNTETEIDFPSNWGRILDFAFHGCDKLEVLTIPDDVKKIGQYAFLECTGLAEITIDAETPPVINSTTFHGVTRSNVTLKVPAGTEDAYRNAGWTEFNIQAQGTSEPSLRISPRNATVEIGKTVELTANVTQPSGNTTWESSDESVATVSDDGIVTGVSVGTAEITAANGNGKSDKATVTVVPAKLQITRARVNTWATNEEPKTGENWNNLFDNNQSSIWHANWGTGSGGGTTEETRKSEAFVDLDLGSVKTVSSIEIDKRNMSNGSGTINELRVLNHDETGETFPNGETMSSFTDAGVEQSQIDADFVMDGWNAGNPSISGLSTSGLSIQTVKAEFAAPITARYIRIGIKAIGGDTKSDYVQVSEIRVFGKDDGEIPPVTPPETPVITQNLESSVEKVNATVALTVTASVSDGGTLSYVWHKDGNVVQSGASNTLMATDLGEYYCVITNTKNTMTKSVESRKCIVKNPDNTTSIKSKENSNSRYGIRFARNIVSDKAEIFFNEELAISSVELRIYDALGNLVFSKNINAGAKVSKGRPHTAGVGSKATTSPFVWNLQNQNGRTVANGTYLVVVEAKGQNGQRYRYSAKLGVKR